MGLQLRAEQQMLLQPRMLQSIEVLQLPSLALESWLLEQAESNEALVVESPLEGPGEASSPVAEPSRDQLLDHAPDSGPDAGSDRVPELPRSPRGSQEATEAHDAMLRNQPERPASLAAVVEEQLAMAELPGELTEWVRFLVGCLDERGFLSATDEELLSLAREQELAGGEASLGRAIGALQGLEPKGLGARDAIEALLLQLDPRDPDYALLCRLLEEFLDELARNHLPGVAKAMGLELADLERLLAILGELDPRPAARLVEQTAPVIVPDVVVESGEHGFEVRVTKSALPAVSVAPELRDLAKRKEQTAEVRRYLRGKLDQARWIVEAVAQRGETLLRVARTVFDHQRSFLEQGPRQLVSLTMGEVAEVLQMHVSTVSRAVAGKYVQTPWGIFALRSFFQAATGDEGAARDEVRARVGEVFAAEDKSQPLSDDEVVGELERRGVHIARRTVAKYRKELGIPSSYRRRQYGV